MVNVLVASIFLLIERVVIVGSSTRLPSSWIPSSDVSETLLDCPGELAVTDNEFDTDPEFAEFKDIV